MKYLATVAALLLSQTVISAAMASAPAAAPQVAQTQVSSAAAAIPSTDATKWDEKATYPTDIVIGNADAPVTIVEYGSLTCPHCAAFQNKKFPELKKEWIDSGKVKLVFRHFPIDMTAMGAAVLVSCLPEQDRHAGVDALYKDINSWATKALKESIPDAFSKALGRELEFTKDFNSCVQDEDFQKEVLRPAFDANQQGVSGTPTFFINGEKFVGYSEADPRQIDNIIIRKLGEIKN
jgi:Protein-disulfide isomerase